MKTINAVYEIELDDCYSVRCWINNCEGEYLSNVQAVLFSPDKKCAGSLDGEIVHLQDLETAGENLWVWCDESADLFAIYEHLLMEDKALHDYSYGGEGDLFHPAWLRTYPGHRGHGLGLKMFAAVLTLVTDWCAFAIMKPLPLQWRDLEESSRPENKKRQQKHSSKLRKHYSPLGFKPIPKSNGHYLRELGLNDSFLGIKRKDWRKIKKISVPDTHDFELESDRKDRLAAGLPEVWAPLPLQEPPRSAEGCGRVEGSG